MKRVLTLVLIFSSLMATAQQLRLTYQGNPLSDGDTIRVEYTQDDLGRDLLRPVIAFENLSESAYSGYTYAVYENVAPGHMIQFCVFGTCVANLSTPIAIELNGHESVTEEDARVLHFTFSPTETGESTVGFIFSNDNDSTDHPVIYVQYYNSTGLDDMPDFTAVRAYPNPSTTGVYVEYDHNLATQANLVIKNLTGAVVSRQPLSETGKSYVNLSDFRSGVYFYGLEDKSGRMLCTKKLLVR